MPCALKITIAGNGKKEFGVVEEDCLDCHFSLCLEHVELLHRREGFFQ
jgi:hypothetical protein